MKNKLLYTATTSVVIIAAATVLLPACDQKQTSANQANDNTSKISTAEAIKNANWSDNVEITINENDNTFRFQSNGIPSHGFAPKYLIPKDVSSSPFADNTADEFTVAVSATDFSETPIDTTITTEPTYVEDVTLTSLGRIGVALSGAQIFNDYENFEKSIAALDDNVIHDHVPFVDECNGHTLINGTNYHYHGIPVCITEAIEVEGQHSVLIGVLEDGFPVYGNQGLTGKIVTNSDLDECGGHIEATPEFPNSIYHYHLTADEAPYMVDCYHGEIDSVESDANPERNGGANARTGNGPDFSSVAAELNVTQDALMQALGDAVPPDFAAAAKALGISEEKLRSAMPAPQ